MKKEKFIIVIAFCILQSAICNLQSFAQQLPLFSQYMLNDYFQNPAVAGSRNYFDAVSINRLQWVGITDAPRTYCFSMNGPITKKNMGIGGYLYSDIAGPTRRTGASGSYAYHIKIQEKIKLSLSLSAGIVQFAMDGSKLTLNDPSDYALNIYHSVMVADLGTSFYLYGTPKENGTGNWWLGGYAPQIFPAKLNLFQTPASTGTLATHLYFTGGYKLFLTDEFSAEPSFLLKFVSPAPMQVDIGTRVIYKQKTWLGVTYRTHDAMSFMAGYIYKENISFGYAYDFTTSGLKKYTDGTHELYISLRFKTPVAPAAPKAE